MKLNGNWTEEDKQFLMQNMRTHSIRQLADALGRTENAVKLFMYRHRLPLCRQVKSPTVVHLLRIKLGDPKWFTPTREFYEQVGIGQKRWTSLAFGYANPTEDELRKIARAFNLREEEWVKLLEASQLNLFDNYEQDTTGNS